MNAVRLWLWISATASLAGWSLSAIGQLNRAGYVVFFALAAGVFSLCRQKIDFPAPKKLFRRFRRPLPSAFLLLAILVFLGGVIYPPSNYTGLNYRLARTLQWLAHDGWFWIHTPIFRMNDRAVGIEWLSAPLVLFTKSDRALFLVNFLPFLLLPGLVFAVFTRLGVRARVAWPWMWLLPLGYDFLLQAGGNANDTFPAVYALAMIAFGCRAWATRKPADLWCAMLAAALMTGAKASNLPLLLAFVILIFPLVPVLRKRWLSTTMVLLLAVMVSFLPIAYFNFHYLHDWSGAAIERANMTMKNPFVGVWGNALQILVNNFLPPLFPLAGWWNHHILNFAPGFLMRALVANFEPDFFDAAIAIHALEHIPDPVAFVTEVRRILKKDGVFLFRIPNFASWEAKVAGDRWYHFDYPFHVSHYSPQAATRLLQTSGFHDVRVNHAAAEYRQTLLYSVLAALKVPLPLWLKIVLLPLQTVFIPLSWLLARLGNSGTIEVVARK